MRMTTLLAIALGFTALVPASAQPRGEGGLRLIDTTQDLDRVWQATKNLPDERRVKAFQSQFESIVPNFYSADRVKDFIKPDRYHELILNGLQSYPEQRDGIQRVSREFATLIEPARREFEQTFGKMTGYPAVYLVHSFGEFDGGTRKLGNGMHLMFGADMINQLYRDRPIKPFVQHELFHLLHGRTFKDCDSIYCNLWQEGLATYVAAKLNPRADDAALGMTIPAPIRPAVEARRSEAICAVGERLDSDRPEDYARLFFGNQKLPGFPARMGYYIGYLVAQDIGRTRNLKQLTALSAGEVKPLIEQALNRLASCPTSASTLERG